VSRAAIPSRFASKTLDVKDSYLHYLEVGEGNPILFLHGNPTSSYLWRNVLPYVERKGRCLALDLIGMGASGKPDLAYRLVDHIAYVEAFIDALGLSNLTLVMHDWGVAIGLHFLTRHRDRVRAVAFMEGHLHSIGSWSDFDEGSREMFKNLRTEGVGEQMVIGENFFIETVLPGGVLRKLSEEEMQAYRAPYLEKHARLPILRWVREIPIEGHPADVHDIVDSYRSYLAATDLPKLLLYARPGALIGAEEVAWCQKTLSNLSTAEVGEGLHFLPEDQPDDIGRALAGWLDTLV